MAEKQTRSAGNNLGQYDRSERITNRGDNRGTLAAYGARSVAPYASAAHHFWARYYAFGAGDITYPI
jgi:hypothetical protein